MSAPSDVRPTLSAVVLTYNHRELLDTVLPSLAAQHLRSLETIVVDNGSSDDTREWLMTHWPEVRVVSLTSNIGVTAALNVCLDSGTGDFVALLNNDVELEPDCLGELARALELHPEAVVATAKLINFHDRGLIDGAGDLYEWTGLARRRGQGLRDVGQYDEPRGVFGACGCVAMYRRSALEEVGRFDDQLFAFYEDVDWSFRAQLLGFKCWYVPTAVAYHMSSATLGVDSSDFALYHFWRNVIWVVMKNYPTSALVRYGYRVLNSQRGNFLWAMRTGRIRLLLRAWRDAFGGMPRLMRKRWKLQSSRRVGLRELQQVIGVDS
jgi:GT2 family glycosyltransferase